MMNKIVFKWNSMKWPIQKDFDFILNQWNENLDQNDWYFFDPSKQIHQLSSVINPYFYKGFIGGCFHMNGIQHRAIYEFSHNIDFIFDRDEFLLKKLASESPKLYRILQDA